MTPLQKHMFCSPEVQLWLDRAAKARITVIGEPILDRYIYVYPLGKSAKENIVTFEPIGTAQFRGGAWIVQQDAAQFSALALYQDEGIAPILKQRYVEKTFNTKLFSTIENGHVQQRMFQPSGDADDVLLIADYGHGLLGPEAIAELCARKTFIAMTVQSNSANWGFNLLTKWPRADYAVVDQNELRLACHDQYGDIERLARMQHERMGTRVFAVTLGHEGCLVLNGGDAVRSPAVAKHVVDRMGAGDAFLAATATLAWVGAPAEVIAIVGNIAGAIKVGKVGNQPVTRAEVDRWLKNLLP